jgi:Protein of unknown function (DUF3489)
MVAVQVASHGVAQQRRFSQWDDPSFRLRTLIREACMRRRQLVGNTCTEMIMTKQKKPGATKPANAQRVPAKPASKLGRLEAMLRRPDGATIEQLSKALDWQAHSVRGAMSGALKKKQGLSVASEKRQNGTRVYRIAA